MTKLTNKQKIEEVEAKLDGNETFVDFIEEQQDYISAEYKERDENLAETIIEFFRDSGMNEGDVFTPNGWNYEYLDEGVALYHGKEFLGAVKWCYRGNMGSCWIDQEES